MEYGKVNYTTLQLAIPEVLALLFLMAVFFYIADIKCDTATDTA